MTANHPESPVSCGVCAEPFTGLAITGRAMLDACPTCAVIRPCHHDCAGQVCAECARPVEDPRQGKLWGDG